MLYIITVARKYISDGSFYGAWLPWLDQRGR